MTKTSDIPNEGDATMTAEYEAFCASVRTLAARAAQAKMEAEATLPSIEATDAFRAVRRAVRITAVMNAMIGAEKNHLKGEYPNIWAMAEAAVEAIEAMGPVERAPSASLTININGLTPNVAERLAESLKSAAASVRMEP